MAKGAVDAARPITLGECADEYRGSSKAIRCQRAGDQFHEVRQDKESHTLEQDQQDRSFDSLIIKFIKFEDVKSILFNKLESSTSQKRTCTTYKINSRSNVN